MQTKKAFPATFVMAAALLVVVSATLIRAALQDTSGAPHGAAAMDRQQAALGALGVPDDITAPPPAVDPVVWGALIPDDNAMTTARVDLGRRLYFELRLSRDGTVACATCHDVLRGFTDNRPVSEGIRDQLGRRNAPTTLNVALLETLFLDGRARSLEHQAGMPILNPIEMGQPSRDAAVRAIASIPGYGEAFEAAYGRHVNYADIERAIAAFERTLVFLDAPLDQFLRGDEDALSADAKKGWELFNGKARCVTCHPINRSNPLGTNHRFHNIGVAARHQDFEALARKALEALARDDSEEALDHLALATDLSELGRFMVTKSRADIGAFRTLQLRNVGITAPYMHDGSMQTLWDVMDHYNKGGEANPYLDGGIEPLALTEEEIDQVVALLFALTDERFSEANAKAFQSQQTRAQTMRPFRDETLAMRRKLPFEDRVMGGGRPR